MIMPAKVEPREGYRIWIAFQDGVEGEVDLSRHAGKGVFKAWEDPEFFATVRIDAPWRALTWGDTDQLDLCTDTLYMELTGKTVDELMPVVDEAQPVG